MEDLEKYFIALLRYFNLKEDIKVSRVNDNRIIIHSNVSPSPFFKKLEEVKDQVYRNIKKSLPLFEPNVNADSLKIFYYNELMTINFSPDTYLDLLPNELLNLVASKLDLSQDILELYDLISSVNRDFIDYTQIVNFKYPTLSQWIILPGKKITKEEFEKIVQLDTVTPNIIRFLEDVKANITDDYITLPNINYIYVIKMRQQFPHFTGVEFEDKFAVELYQVYTRLINFQGYPDLLNYILTGKLLDSPNYNISSILTHTPHFVYHLIKDPLVYNSLSIELLDIIASNREVLQSYKNKLTQEELRQIIELIGDKSLRYYNDKTINIMRNLISGQFSIHRYIIETHYPHLLKDVPPNVDISNMASEILNEKKKFLYYRQYNTSSLREITEIYSCLNNFIDTGTFECSLPSISSFYISPYLSYLLLINPSFKVSSNSEYLTLLSKLPYPLLNAYLSKLTKQDIQKIINMYGPQIGMSSDDKRVIFILENFL